MSHLCIKNARQRYQCPDTEDFLVIHGRIFAMGKELFLPEGVPVFDAEGKFISPALIDQHVHVTGGGGEGGFSHQIPPIKAEEIIQGGVGTVVGLLGTDGTSRSIENLLAKTKGLKEEGLTAYCYTGAYEYPSPTLTGSVRRDLLFIEEIIGVKLAISDHRGSGISRDDFRRLAYEVRQAGILARKPGVLHLHIGAGKSCLDQVFELMAESDIPPTQCRPTHMGRHIAEGQRFAQMGGYVDLTTGGDPEQAASALLQMLEKAPARQFTLSSDSNGSMPQWNAKGELIGITAASIQSNLLCLKALVQKGLPFDEALAFLTMHPAKALGLYPRKGSLQLGADADLLLWRDDLSLDAVVLAGRLRYQRKDEG